MNERFRFATKQDYAAVADVMYDAVRNGPSLYNQAQRMAWVPHRRGGAQWEQRLDSQNIMLVEAADRLLGFMSLANQEYIDFAYIRPEAQGSGIFRRLYCRIEELALQSGTKRLSVHASLMAQPAFTAMGFNITQKEEVEIDGQFFERFEMQKQLTGEPKMA